MTGRGGTMVEQQMEEATMRKRSTYKVRMTKCPSGKRVFTIVTAYSVAEAGHTAARNFPRNLIDAVELQSDTA